MKFSTSWKASKKPTKQRNYQNNAPLHIKGKFVHAHLSDDLKKKHGKRAVRVRTGDKVKVMTGQFKGTVGSIESVNLKTTKVYVTGVEYQKKDGTKVRYPIHASNVMITELKADKKRFKERS